MNDLLQQLNFKVQIFPAFELQQMDGKMDRYTNKMQIMLVEAIRCKKNKQFKG